MCNLNKNVPYLSFLNIIKESRKNIISDTLEESSEDLYDALYSDFDSEIYKVKMELYEMQWIESHWKEIERVINRKECSEKDKKELVLIFYKLYESFIKAWNYTEFDTIVFEEKRKILQAMIIVNSDWEKDLKREKVSFYKSIKLLKSKVKEVKELKED